MYLSTSTEDFPEMYLSTFQVLYKLYLSTDVLKYKVLLPGSGNFHMPPTVCTSMLNADGQLYVYILCVFLLTMPG